MEPNPDRRLYAEQVAWAAARFVEHLPDGDPLRASLLADADPADTDWAILGRPARRLDHHPPPGGGPTVRYVPLERLYRVPFDDPPRVVVAQAGDRREGAERLDAGSVYIGGRSVTSLME